jgi:hypothetical protein
VPYKELSESLPSITAAKAEVTIIGDDNRAANMKSGVVKRNEYVLSSNLYMTAEIDKKLNYKTMVEDCYQFFTVFLPIVKMKQNV